jgi:hypothetical protein
VDPGVKRSNNNPKKKKKKKKEKKKKPRLFSTQLSSHRVAFGF